MYKLENIRKFEKYEKNNKYLWSETHAHLKHMANEIFPSTKCGQQDLSYQEIRVHEKIMTFQDPTFTGNTR